jgi:PAS domain S-box-containing protein
MVPPSRPGDNHLRIVAAAARAFAELTTDEANLLDAIARRVASAVRGACSVALLSDDAAWLEMLIELDSEAPAIADGSFVGLRRVRVSEGSAMTRALGSDDGVLDQTATGASSLSVALRARREVIGVLHCTTRSARLGPEELALVRDLADHAALAIANGRLIRALEEELAQGQRPAEDGSSQRFLDAVVENIPHMIFVKDAERLAFVRFNKAGEELLGLQRDDLLGKNDHDFFPPEEAAFFQAKDRETLRGKAMVDIPMEPIQTKNGLRWLHTKKVPILDADGTPAYLLGISEDITERKRADQELRDLAAAVAARSQELEAANKELEAFSYSVSHDLRAPLRAIDGFSRLLDEEHGPRLDSEGQRLIAVIRRNTRSMAQLIDDLLVFSRLGRQALRAHTVDMAEIARSVVEEVKASEPERSIEVTVADLPAAICDPTLIRQVWINLIGNAFKYTRPRAPGVITITGALGESEVTYTVGDNGVGFDMRYGNKLFGVFQRLHPEKDFEGTGVGLALVQRIIHRHGGRVWAEGELDRGARFSFALPMSI